MTDLISSQELETIRALVLDRLRTGGERLSFDELASRLGVSVAALRTRFGQPVQLVDEVVAGVLRRARPIVRAERDYVTDAGRMIADLVRGRLLVDEQISPVWHLIGQGEASVQEFDALRLTLSADVAIRLGPRLDLVDGVKRVEVLRIVDGALSLAAVHSLQTSTYLTAPEAAQQLAAQVRRLFVTFGIESPPSRSSHLLLVDP